MDILSLQYSYPDDLGESESSSYASQYSLLEANWNEENNEKNWSGLVPQGDESAEIVFEPETFANLYDSKLDVTPALRDHIPFV